MTAATADTLTPIRPAGHRTGLRRPLGRRDDRQVRAARAVRDDRADPAVRHVRDQLQACIGDLGQPILAAPGGLDGAGDRLGCPGDADAADFRDRHHRGVISSLIGSVNGYVFAKWRFPGSDLVFTLFLFGMFLPYPAIMIPLQQMLFNDFGPARASPR